MVRARRQESFESPLITVTYRFESFPIVFMGIYGFPDQLLGLSYIGILVGALAIVPFFFAYLKYYQEPRYSASGDLRPEERMPVAIFAAPIGTCH